ncbi:SulP family inorganic anion transporter [Candidatus Avelusimicrobium fimicolum]|uniref:SulP family inorganic anion transporter n=1 Tax=Candidatus Avelusimicrobium fimicolum TaxID=3416216 RepID=UPI003D0E10B7
MNLLPKLVTLWRNHPEEFTPKRMCKDITSGLVVACVALPLSIALAIASGVTPEKGLLTAIVAGFLISLLGGSRVQIGGPTGAFVVIVYGIIQEFGLSGLLTATLMAGIFLMLMGLFKFGAFIKFIPYPVTTGFTSGIAVVLFSTQINDFLGLHLTDIPSDFFAKWNLYFHHLSAVNWETLAVGLLTLAIIIFWPKKWKALPGSLAALIFTTLVVKFAHLEVATITSTFGAVDSTLVWPHMPGEITLATIKKLLPASLTIAFLAGIESLLSAVVADGMIGKKHRSNMELIATGAANVAAALFGGLPATGAIARTATNIENGGRTPVAGMAHAIFLLIMMLCLMQYIGLIPMTSLAAILFMVAYRMSGWRAFRALFKAPASDVAILLVTFGLTVAADLVVAIEFGLVLAAVLFMKRMSDVYQIKNMDDDIFDEVHQKDDIDTKIITHNVSVYEINGPFFFGAANVFVDSLENHKECKVLILRMRSVPAMDATGFHALESIFNSCQKDGVQLILSHVQKPVLKTLEKYGFIKRLGKDHICKNIDISLMRAESIVSGRQHFLE